jgi:hypothetical protein
MGNREPDQADARSIAQAARESFAQVIRQIAERRWMKPRRPH